MNVAVIGAGYVGLTVSVCLAEMGHAVRCVENDPERLATLQQGDVPFHEPRVGDLLRRGIDAARLCFTGDLRDAAEDAELIIIAVGTPGNGDGAPDLSALDAAVAALSRLRGHAPVAIKSTVPVGTTEWVEERLAPRGFGVACNPEFLREGSAVSDFFHPHRIIIGTTSGLVAGQLRTLYEPLEAPVVVTTPRTAEMIKYASNAFLATRVSFINEVASICERTGVDVNLVAEGMGLDPRIGRHYLQAGIGFGGSCLPKDVRALAALARGHGLEPALLDAVMSVNETRRSAFVQAVEEAVGGAAGRNVAILGLAFKPGTSDIRESPAMDIAARLLARKARIRAYDPVAEPAAAALLPEITYCPSIEETIDDADAVLILTDWPEFRNLDWATLAPRTQSRLLITAESARDGYSIIRFAGSPVLTRPE